MTLYKLVNNLEKTDRKDLMKEKKKEKKEEEEEEEEEEAGYLKGHKEKLQNEICLNDTKKSTIFP